MLSALGLSHGGSGSKGGDRLAKFTHQERIKSFLSNDILARTEKPITFRMAGGNTAYGYEAEVLANICFAILDAGKNKKLMKQQEHILIQAEILVRGFAIVGINALVDEATGYQDIRDRQALQAILKRYIDGKLYEWTKTFPTAFFKEIFRLKGWVWNHGKMPVLVGKYINDLVYSRLAPGVLDELKRNNPPDEKGRRKVHHHRLLTRDIGHPELTRRIYELLGMARAFKSGEWEQFKILVNRTFPKPGQTLELKF